jgi:hypothetical protein
MEHHEAPRLAKYIKEISRRYQEYARDTEIPQSFKRFKCLKAQYIYSL